MDYSTRALLNLNYPDFTARHVFSAKLRIVILAGFWILAGIIYPGLLTLEQPIMLIISGTFVVTTICYFFILRGVASIFFFIIELAADVAAQTVLVYLTGGAKSDFFTIYIMYCAAGGLFFNYQVAVIMAVLSLIFYLGMIAAGYFGWLAPFAYSFHQANYIVNLGEFQNWGLLVLFQAISVYGIWVASYFTKLREKALEAKNRELIALNRVSSVTRSVMTFETLAEEVIRGVRDGMGYLAAFILHYDQEEQKIRLITQKDGPYMREIEALWGISLDDVYLPVENRTNLVYEAMRKKKRIIRYELAEVLRGMSPEISTENAEAVQRMFSFNKFLAAPLVSEDKVLGALIGVSHEEWIEPEAVRTFEGFADHAALTLDNALLIAELKRKNVELERVSRVKSEFLATMSHELRTPLTAIIGFSELLLEEVMGQCNDEQKESLREILVNGENLLHIINGLLDLAKIESGKMELIAGPVSIQDLLVSVQGMVQSLVQKKSQNLEMVVKKEPFPLFYADEKKLQQVLLNLLSNAIKFTPVGGKVSVIVDQHVDRVEISVVDTGIGIAEKDLKTIFESFRQVDSSYTREYQGTGLGLALVKQFVELHGGQIGVKSQLGQGADFTFWVPVNPQT